MLTDLIVETFDRIKPAFKLMTEFTDAIKNFHKKVDRLLFKRSYFSVFKQSRRRLCSKRQTAAAAPTFKDSQS